MPQPARPILFIILLASVLSSPAGAEVTHAADGGFSLRIEAEVPASPAAVWTQFVAVGEWWDADHSWFGKSENFSLEPAAGGCFCEREGDRSALHMLVSWVDPGRELRMIGGLGPLQGLALHGAMSWRFEPLDTGGTRIVHTYRVMGYLEDGLGGLAPVVDRVQSLQVSRLVEKLTP